MATGRRLDRLPLLDEETRDLTVVLETPKASRNKYKYDAEHDVMRLGATLGEGLAFPYDFGFFPSTLGEDGDPLDVLVFLDAAVPPGCVTTARLIGVLEVEQKEKRTPWKRNDRFFAVGTEARSHQRLKHLDDLRPDLLPEIESFFTHYAGLAGKELRIVRRGGPQRARMLVKAGAKACKAGK
ncbi:inorganic pyrophosphatase [Rhodospirillales bacterium URHD0017]|nr:inorganic pyrophosphatase [Rhodospirillales bacterium URHD0017]